MRIRIIDAFADEPFRGNPAAVCLLPGGGWPDEAWMQRVAAEMNLSETAFAKPRTLQEALQEDRTPQEEGEWDLRWFTPQTEVSMCGHATLATAHALAEDGVATRVGFHTLSGVLTTEAEGDEIVMDFPASPVSLVDTPEGLAEALGSEVKGAYDTGALGDLLVELPSAQAVRELKPDFLKLLRYAPRCVIVTAAEDDFVSRVFCPAVGINEDPVTGSAHTALGPFWSARSGRTALVGVQASARSGRVLVDVRGDRVLLRGRAVTMLDGRLAA
jgi:PhzF family phenazine biosynthesis protein